MSEGATVWPSGGRLVLPRLGNMLESPSVSSTARAKRLSGYVAKCPPYAAKYQIMFNVFENHSVLEMTSADKSLRSVLSDLSDLGNLEYGFDM